MLPLENQPFRLVCEGTTLTRYQYDTCSSVPQPLIRYRRKSPFLTFTNNLVTKSWSIKTGGPPVDRYRCV